MDRKEIIKALEGHFNVKAQYMGVPSFAYQIEINNKMYKIAKDGVITAQDGSVIEFGSLMEDDTKEVKMEVDYNAVEVSMDGHTGVTLRNILNMIHSKQVVIKKALAIDFDVIDKNFIEEFSKKEINTIKDFEKALMEVGNAPKTITFDFIRNNIKFTICQNCDTDKLAAYIMMVVMLCKYAKKLKFASCKPTITDNEKFTMRTWLIRLGFIGDDFKEARKELLKNLSGNTAFR